MSKTALNHGNDPTKSLGDYRDILDVLSVGNIVHFALLDLNFIILDINSTWDDYGKTRGVKKNYNWVGKSYLKPIEASCVAGDKDALLAYTKLSELKAGIINEFSMVYPCEEPDTTRWFRCSAKKITKKEGDFFIISHLDITNDVEQKLELEKNNQSLINEKKKLEQIEQQMLFGRWSCSFENRVLKLSNTAQNILSPLLKNKQVTLDGLANCLESDQQHFFKNELAETIRKKTPFNFEGHFKLGENETRYLLISGFWADEKNICNDETIIKNEIFGLITDMTEERKLKNELAHMQKIEMLGKLTAEISHNFNNALSIIRGNLELLREFSQPTTVRFLNRIERATNQATDLTNKLNHFMSNSEQFFENFCIVKRLNDLVEMSEKMLGNGITFDIHLPKAAIIIKSDPLEFDNSVLNLIINARDAMPDGGKLTLKLETEIPDGNAHQNVNLHIIDEGIGIEKNQTKQIFEPFYTTKEMGKGTGLGLAAVKKFVQNSQGEISVNSNTSQGTEFIITFPLVKAQPNDNECKACKNYGGNHLNLTACILVIEDETDLRSMVSDVLNRNGMTVYEASNTQEACEIVKSNRKIDLVLTDIILGPNDLGTNFEKWFKEQKPSTPVLFTSGYTNDVLRLKKIDPSSSDFIAKPYSLDMLVKKIKEKLEMSKGGFIAQENSPAQGCKFQFNAEACFKMDQNETAESIIQSGK